MTLSLSKKLSLLFHGITSKHKGDFDCLNCFDFFRTEEKLDLMKKIYKNKDFCGIAMPSEKNINYNLINKCSHIRWYKLFMLILNLNYKVRWILIIIQ